MARPKKTDDEQMQLIEVDHPAMKKFKSLRNSYENYISEKNEAHGKAKGKREEMMTHIREEMGIKPDADGAYRFQIGEDEVVEITQGESQLKFKNKPKKKDPDPEDEDTTDADS